MYPTVEKNVHHSYVSYGRKKIDIIPMYPMVEKNSIVQDFDKKFLENKAISSLCNLVIISV